MTTAIVTDEMIEAGWKEAQVKDIRDDRSHKQRFIDGLSAALTPHGEEAAAMAPESHSKASEIIAAIRHQLEINVQIAEQNSPEGPIVDGKRVKGLTHSQDILAQHIRDHLSELELVIATLAPQQHVEGLPLASDIEKLGGWTLSHDFVDQLARKAEEETTYPCPMEVAEHIALTVAGILRSSPPPESQKLVSIEAHMDAARDINTLLAQIDFLQEATGERLEMEDAAIVEQIREAWGGNGDPTQPAPKQRLEGEVWRDGLGRVTPKPAHADAVLEDMGYIPAPASHVRGEQVFPTQEEIHHLAKLALEEMQREATTDPAAWVASYERIIMSYRRLALAKQQEADRKRQPCQPTSKPSRVRLGKDVIKAICDAVVLGEGEDYQPVHLEPREAKQAISAYLEAIWRPISQADKSVDRVIEVGGIRIANSEEYWVRDADGRAYRATWADDGKRAYWWDFEAESPVDPVEFMPHPLDPRWAALASEGQNNG